jgi:UPF0755 protein
MKKRASLLSITRILAVLICLAVIGLALIAWDAHNFLASPLSIKQPQLIQVPKNSSLGDLSHRLAALDAIHNPRDTFYFKWYGRVNGSSRRMKAGEYQLKPGMSPMAFLDKIVHGDTYRHSLTIIDGWTFRQMMAAIESDSALKHRLKGDTKKQIMAAIGHKGIPAEGRFAPNTYYFPRGMTDVTFLKKAYNTMQRILNKQWAERAKNLPLKNKEQALTLASIIEKETSVPSELGRVAGVFVRRLKKGMKLEADPTVIYGLLPGFDGSLTRADMHKNTPYNTYVHRGLPPTPISLPSKPAIHAALHPTPGKALYFVAKGNGTHHFSATFAEHKRAIRKYELHSK